MKKKRSLVLMLLPMLEPSLSKNSRQISVRSQLKTLSVAPVPFSRKSADWSRKNGFMRKKFKLELFKMDLWELKLEIPAIQLPCRVRRTRRGEISVLLGLIQRLKRRESLDGIFKMNENIQWQKWTGWTRSGKGVEVTRCTLAFFFFFLFLQPPCQGVN